MDAYNPGNSGRGIEAEFYGCLVGKNRKPQGDCRSQEARRTSGTFIFQHYLGVHPTASNEAVSRNSVDDPIHSIFLRYRRCTNPLRRITGK